MTDEKGFVHIYTGDGKGKTTAALGLVCRAVGAGWNVLFAQFLKKGRFSEIAALERFGDQVKVLQFGSGRFVGGRPSGDDIRRASKGLEQVAELVCSGHYDMAVLDEVNIALHLGMLETKDVIHLVENRPARMEIVMTGRNSPEALMEHADLITECRLVKHYYDRGIKARTGIEK